MTQTLPKGCSKCKQRGYGSVQGEILDESPDYGREVKQYEEGVVARPTVTVERAPKIAKGKSPRKTKGRPVVAPVVQEGAFEELDEADIPSWDEMDKGLENLETRAADLGVKVYNSVSCPKKALHPKVIRCSTCGFHA